MKATGIVRRIDDLGRVVIPKEIRRTMRIKEGELSFITLTEFDRFYIALHSVVERTKAE
ncbi:MAG: stage V sporulation protein T [Clostridia bacterium]|nr:stage V sporulation protein T [Clostridia bacterium]